jgi:hypothetical protein
MRIATSKPWTGRVLLAFWLVWAVARLIGTETEPAAARSRDRTTRLFNGRNLSGFYTFLTDHGRNSDPNGIFTVHDGMVHVLGKEFGYFCTEKEYENYHLIVEFKWGERRWPPRETAVRDSGVLLHMVGTDKVWPRSIECQVQEHDCGDFYLVDGTSITVDGTKRQGRVVKKQDAEKPTGEWNTIEVICDGARIRNIVNGLLVNEGSEASVTRGRICFQSEGAEVFYRRIDLQPLARQ